MSGIKHLNLSFTLKDFKKLQKVKEKYYQNLQLEHSYITWESLFLMLAEDKLK